MAELNDLFRSNQYVGPDSLTELCFKLICENLDIISTIGKHGYRTLYKGLVFPSEICDKIIEYFLSQNDTVEDHDCFFTIFKNLSATKLKRVKVVRCNLTDRSVQILASHKLVDLELTDCPNITEYAIEYMNANSENLRTFICHGTSVLLPAELSEYQKRGYVFKAPNLRHLALGYVTISPPEYYLLLAGLTSLTHLDLSTSFDVGTFDFYNLLPNLVSLILYNVKINDYPQSLINNICHLKNLRQLDIAQSNEKLGIFENPTKLLSDLVNGLPELVSLDIGGTNLAGRETSERCIDSNSNDMIHNNVCDIPGLASRVNRPLQFLGLYGAHDEACRRHNIPARMIAGDATEDQLLLAAHVAMKNKEDVLHKILSDLYRLFRYENCYRMDQALCTVLQAMEKHPLHKSIQVVGSSMLHYIIKIKENGEMNARLKKRFIRTLLTAMSIHKDEETIMSNGCLALCEFQIPTDVMTNYETLVKVLLYVVKHTKLVAYIRLIGVHLLHSLTCLVEGKEKRLLGQLGCVKTMLELVEYKIESGVCDEFLELAWSTMWNITDETPINCQRFLDENGMDLFLKCVKQQRNKETLLRNMMGLIGNVAEVQHLRVHLMKSEYVAAFICLLRSYTNRIEVSYNATGILAHMASDGPEAWTIVTPTRCEVLQSMVIAIEKWDIHAERNINYRSFVPLLRLLDVYHTPECQYWAVWALANLTNFFPKKYCELLEKENGLEKLEALIKDPRAYWLKGIAVIVIRNCRKHRSKTNSAENTIRTSIKYH